MRVAIYAGMGCAWAIVAVVFGHPIGWLIWGGILISPLIGIAMGLIAEQFSGWSSLGGRLLVSLLSLYSSAALFGLGVGALDWFTGTNSGDGWRRIPIEVLRGSILGVWWGLTFTGYFLLLWPLSHASHIFVWTRAGNQRRSVRGVRG